MRSTRSATVAATIEKVRTTSAFVALQQEWCTLLEDSATSCVFLTWEWLYAWWTHLRQHRRLFILTVRRGDQLIGIAPFVVNHKRLSLPRLPTLEFLGAGDVGSDYLDLIARRGCEEEVVATLATYLGHRRFALDMPRVPGRVSLAAALAFDLEQQGWNCLDLAEDICPVIRLAGHSWDSYLASLGAHHRYNFRRRLRNLHKAFDVAFAEVATDGDRRDALATLIALHMDRWRQQGGSTAFHAPALRAFHEALTRTMLGRGWLRLYVLRLDGRPAAALYGFSYKRRFYFYQSGFDTRYAKYSVGLVLMGLAIRQALDEGLEEYDLLHGDEPYKFLWTRHARRLTQLRMYPPGLRGEFHQRTARLTTAAKQLVRRAFYPPQGCRPCVVLPES